MAVVVRSLEDLIAHGGTVQCTCRCGRVALFEPSELALHWRRKGWSTEWTAFARRLRCKPPEGCGERNPRVTWIASKAPPPHDPEPPRPRFTRRSEDHWRPPGIDKGEWDRAKDDRDRRNLIRRARG